MLNKNIINRLNKKDENFNLLWAALILVVVGVFIYFRNHNSLGEIKEKHIYTVGTIRDYSPSRTGKMLNYTYFFKGKAYTGGYTFYSKDERFTIGNRFLVILNPDDPETKFFIPYQISEDIDVPLEGWKEPPFDITESDVMRYLEVTY